MTTGAYFDYARERQSILLRRRAGMPRSKWTSDPWLSKFRFCNIFREDDRTTMWFRERVRGPMRADPDVLLATVIFRWFNRISTGEAIFLQKSMQGSATPWDMVRDCPLSDTHEAVQLMGDAIKVMCGPGPYVTGAFIVKAPAGQKKIDGLLWCIEQFMSQEHTPDDGDNPVGWRQMAQVCLDYPGDLTLETVWAWLKKFPYLGDFTSYEIVTDLRHTTLLDGAPDIMTWASPGPGAMRGLNRVHDRDLKYRQPRELFVREMRDLLAESQNVDHWPQLIDCAPVPPADEYHDIYTHERYCDDIQIDHTEKSSYSHQWPSWEMRDVEHTLCEFDKYERVRLGQGKTKGVYK